MRSWHVSLLPTPRTCSAPVVACTIHSARSASECTATAMLGNAWQRTATHGHARTRTATHARQVTAFHGNARFSCYRTVHSTGERQCTAISRLTRLSTTKHGKARQSTAKHGKAKNLQQCAVTAVLSAARGHCGRDAAHDTACAASTRQLTATTCNSRRRHQQQHNAPSHSHDTVMIYEHRAVVVW